MRSLGLLLLTAALCPQSAAQIPLHRFEGTATSPMGPAMAATGDVNGDGVPDLAVGGAPVRLFSGLDGSLLRTFPADTGDLAYGLSGLGDVVADGHGDLAIIQTGPPVRVDVFSGGSGAVLYSLPLNVSSTGYNITSIADADGDGVRELCLGSAVHSGATGTLVLAFSEAPSARVREAGDFNADGTADYAVGSGIYSGLTANLIAAHGIPGGLYCLTGIGDVNGDGYDDVGATYHHAVKDHDTTVVAGPNASVLLTREWPFLDMAPVGDIDGDGYDEWVMGGDGCVMGGCGRGRIFMARGLPSYSPHTEFRVYEVPGESGNELFGTRVVNVGDIDQDGLPDFAASSRSYAAGLPSSYVRVFLSRPAVASSQSVGLGCGPVRTVW